MVGFLEGEPRFLVLERQSSTTTPVSQNLHLSARREEFWNLVSPSKGHHSICKTIYSRRVDLATSWTKMNLRSFHACVAVLGVLTVGMDCWFLTVRPSRLCTEQGDIERVVFSLFPSALLDWSNQLWSTTTPGTCTTGVEPRITLSTRMVHLTSNTWLYTYVRTSPDNGSNLKFRKCLKVVMIHWCKISAIIFIILITRHLQVVELMRDALTDETPKILGRRIIFSKCLLSKTGGSIFRLRNAFKHLHKTLTKKSCHR